MACLIGNMTVEVDQPSITAISLSSSGSGSTSSTITPDEFTGDSRMARALQLLLSEGDPVTCTRGGTLEMMRSTRKAASSEDILLSANKQALQMHAFEYWRATSSMDALNCCVEDDNTRVRGKSATLFAATQLWRSIVVNLEQQLRARPHRRLSLRRMLCLHPQYHGSDVLDCLLNYLTTTAGRHVPVSREQACVICSKLIASGAMENAKDSSCLVFEESACYRFTGHPAWKVSPTYSLARPLSLHLISTREGLVHKTTPP